MNAPDKAIEIKATVTGVFAFVTALIGWVGWGVMLFAACLFVDYLSGSLAAKKNGVWTSSKAREGLWHKLGEIFGMIVAAFADTTVTVVFYIAGDAIPFDRCIVFLPLALAWYIFTELGSICENAKLLGAPIPDFLVKGVNKAKETVDAAAKEQN